MKTPSLLAFLTVLLLAQCDSDPSTLATDSKFKLDGKEYPLTKGFIGLSCATPDADLQFYAIDVYLFGPETGFTGLCPGFFPTGRGKGISLSLLSKSATEITPGLYAEPNQANMNDVKLLSSILYEYSKADATVSGSFVSKGLTGSVTVSKSGDEYTIELNLARVPAFGGGKVTGRFIGKLEAY